MNLLVDTLRGVPTVPVTAVRNGAKGDFVFLLQPDKTVKLQLVKTGPSVGTNIAILSGVKVGETVITEGADNLEDGSKVVLPGDKPQGGRPQKSGGFLSGLFGGGSEAPAAGGQGGGERRQRREGAGSNASGGAARP